MGEEFAEEGCGNEMPDDFVAHVRSALEHLYDVHALQQHPLAQDEAFLPTGTGQIRSQQLRRELVEAIEGLDPGEDVPFRAPHARLYNVLSLHYLERLTTQETAYQLGISARQAQRNLRDGERDVATLLWARRAVVAEREAGDEASAAELSSFQAEMSRIDPRARPTELLGLVERARRAVGPLAEQRNVKVCVQNAEEPVMLSVDPMIAEQALVVLLSHGTSHAVSSSIVQVTWATINAQVRLTLDYQPATQTETGASSALNPVLGQLAERLGWSIDQPDAEEAMQRLIVGMAAHCPRVLIIDDNQGLVELLRRYLGDRACQVNAATSSAEGLRLAFETAPHAIVLDVMMPDMSGWEVLQRLRGDPRTSAVPIVVCSVVSDPELAMALGATCFLAKPIRQEDVLHALDEIGVL